MLRAMAFVFPMNHDSPVALLSRGWLNTCLSMGSGQRIPGFLLLVCVLLLYLLNCIYLNPRVFLVTLPIVSQFHWWGASEQLCGVWCLPGVKPGHTSKVTGLRKVQTTVSFYRDSTKANLFSSVNSVTESIRTSTMTLSWPSSHSRNILCRYSKILEKLLFTKLNPKMLTEIRCQNKTYPTSPC